MFQALPTSVLAHRGSPPDSFHASRSYQDAYSSIVKTKKANCPLEIRASAISNILELSKNMEQKKLKGKKEEGKGDTTKPFSPVPLSPLTNIKT
jgi:hypothetical protein